MSSVLALATVVGVCTGAGLHPLMTRLDTLPCGTSTMKPGERVIIQSTNFPQNYPVDERCQWEISCDPQSSTKLEFICPSFDVENSNNCMWDRLQVTQHGDKHTHCGTDSPDGTMTNDGWTRLTWFSNSKTTAKGFRCFIWCREQTTTPAATTTTLATTPEATTEPATTAPVAKTEPATTAAETTTVATTAAETTTVATTAAETTTLATTAAETTTIATTAVETTTAATTAADTTTVATTAAETTAATTAAVTTPDC